MSMCVLRACIGGRGTGDRKKGEGEGDNKEGERGVRGGQGGRGEREEGIRGGKTRGRRREKKGKLMVNLLRDTHIVRISSVTCYHGNYR